MSVRDQEVDLTTPRQPNSSTEDAPNHETGGKASGRLCQTGLALTIDRNAKLDDDPALSTKDGKQGKKTPGGIPFFNGQRCPLTYRAWRVFAGNKFSNY